jgi:hypothetical protein
MSQRVDHMNVIKGFIKAAHDRGDDTTRRFYLAEWTRRATGAKRKRAPKYITRGPR